MYYADLIILCAYEGVTSPPYIQRPPGKSHLHTRITIHHQHQYLAPVHYVLALTTQLSSNKLRSP